VGIVYDVGLLLALVTGCAIGVLAAFAHYERAAHWRWAYEREAAEGREIYAALGAYRRIKPGRAPDHRQSTG
jgi:predicted component of type VI protein secretion system